jgi:aminoglycoside phosphotransferase (APT) family kinase protein
MPVAWGSPQEAAQAFDQYVRQRMPGLEARLASTSIPVGWETYVFAVRLAGTPESPVEDVAQRMLGRDLVVRVYYRETSQERIRNEYEVQSLVSRRGYPAPEPFLLELGDSPLGAPFMVMARLEGANMLDLVLSPRVWRTLALVRASVDAQHRLHSLAWSAEELAFLRAEPVPEGPYGFVDRMLAWPRQLIEEHRFETLERPLRWLEARRETVPCHRQAMLHLDFHPANLLVRGNEVAGVLDWSNSQFGDVHADVATTIVLVLTAGGSPSGLAGRAVLAARGLLVRLYLHFYRRRTALDPHYVRYYEALVALQRAAYFATLHAMGPEALGMASGTLAQLRGFDLAPLVRLLESRIGERVEFDVPSPSGSDR